MNRLLKWIQTIGKHDYNTKGLAHTYSYVNKSRVQKNFLVIFATNFVSVGFQASLVTVIL